jgi:cell shape-determining protein MreC
MADQLISNGSKVNVIAWIAVPLVSTVLGVIVSEFKSVTDHANRISVLEVATQDLKSRIEKIDQKLDRLLEFHREKK